MELFWLLLGLIAYFGSFSNWKITAFNVETKHYTLYKSFRQSMFGFSVAEYRDSVGRGSVIVGAPAAETNQKDIIRGGSVFKCDISQDDSCHVVRFDTRNGNSVTNTSHGFVQVDNKSGQWFGATVSSSKVDGGPLLACAPRYLWYGKQVSKGHSGADKREPVGTCWLTNFVSQPLEFSPCRTGKQGYNLQGSCQAGLGASVSKDGKRLFIGAPGSWYWQGQLYSYNGLDNRTKVLMTKEGSPQDDDSYMGYSVTSGDYQGNGKSDVAVGIPRGNNLMGQVALFDSQMKNYRNITGEQMGGYFGYALASGDLNGDGFDDLIISAPMFTLPGNLEVIETGRVYIAYRAVKSNALFDKKDFRDGEFNRGRFGLSLAFLGDTDHDGYGDIAIGAPYAGPEGRGAVYIYRGSKDGLGEKYSQVIFSTDLKDRLATFGFSIAGGQDLDQNTYPDLVVGAYDSDAALFFRSRPVIRADCKVEYFFERHSKMSGINLDNKDCAIRRGSERVSCMFLKVFLKYDADYSHQTFDIELILDPVKIKNPRMFFIEQEGRNVMTIKNVTLERRVQWSRIFRVYVTPHIRDKLTGIDAEARLTLSENREPDMRPRSPDTPLRPVLAETTSLKDSIYIRKNCGDDNICIPDLQLTSSASVEKYLLGSGQDFHITVTVKNLGEDAYEAMFYLQLPPHVQYINFEQFNNTGVLVQCLAPNQNNILRCDIGNPMPRGKMVKFKTILEPIVAENMNATFDFKMEVNTTNLENSATVRDNHEAIKIPVWVDLELVVEGESRPKELFYNPENYTSENITTDVEFGPAIVHNYTVRNNGPSNFLSADVFVTWPGKTLGGDDLLYLMEEPQGTIKCVNADYNYHHLKYTDSAKTRYSSLYGSSGYNHQHYQDHHYQQSSGGIAVQKGYDSSDDRRRIEVNTGDSSEFNQIRHSNNNNYQDKITTLGGEEKKIFVTSESSRNYDLNTAGFGGGSYRKDDNIGRNDSKHYSYGQRKITVSPVSSSFDLLKQQEIEKQRAELEEEKRKLYEEKKKFDELKRINQKKLAEEERIRQQEKNDEEDYDYNNSRGSTIYGTERHFGEDREESRRHQGYGVLTNSRFDDEISGDREEVIGSSDINIRMRNITSTQDLEQFFSDISRGTYKVSAYNRHGKNFINFRGRIGTMKTGQKCIVFQDGTQFPLEDNLGQRVLSDPGSPVSHRFGPVDGELIAGPGNRAYIQLNNGNRFALEGFSTYSTVRTYSYTSSPQESSFDNSPYKNGQIYGHSSGSSWRTESSRDIGEEYHSSHSHDEMRTNEKRIQSKVYTRNSEAPIRDSWINPQYESHERNIRHRRETDMNDNSNGLSLKNELDPVTYDITKNPCKRASCFQIKCELGPLKKGEEAHLSLKFRIKAATLKKVAYREPIQVSTQVLTRITRFAALNNVAEQNVKSQEVFTNVEPTAPPPVADVVPLWVVVLSACAGVIILLLLIYLLHKCGFFKRNRPTDAPERQPLNRNGHFHGDDH
ncbi:integrin alpha-PS2 isoform X2 [Leptopilina boulardi]|uniref:integrin alpha-PS2 isoform X2 n=1 Tax=Leptopilina boulardi TaxID=63433 RepID=UPI0021F5548A|nr:integrin alpha-PS2 isoform X2 [Leptopilina boulardi]